MLKLKQELTKKEKFNLTVLINEITDNYREFYLTKNHLRLYIADNLDVLWKNLNKGDKIIYEENNGMVIITGYAEKKITIFNIKTNKEEEINSRKYIKFLAKDNKTMGRFLDYINMLFQKTELYCKIKKTNPFLKIFYEYNWKFLHGRGNELLIKKPIDMRQEFIPFKD